MERHTIYRVHFHFLLFFLTITSFWTGLSTCKLDTRQVIVEFDPYVSILDKENRSRYNINDLQLLIAKVATNFSKIYIEFTDADLKLTNSSLVQSPLAAATYNCLQNASQRIEVWLGLYRDSVDQVKDDQSLSSILSIVNNANNICSGTVTNILISQKISPVEVISVGERSWYRNYNRNIDDRRHSKHNSMLVGLGLLILFPYECDEALIHRLSPNLVVFHKRNYNTENLDTILLEECKQKFLQKNQSIEFGVKIGYPDTLSNNYLNRTNLVTSWKKEIKWAKESENFVILSRAFDTPYKYSVEDQTMGWWRVRNNCTDKNKACEFAYICKGNKDVNLDWQENPRNYNWLKSHISFYENANGLIFYASELTKLQRTSDLIERMSRNKNIRVIIIDETSETLERFSAKINFKEAKKYGIDLGDMTRDEIKLKPFGRNNYQDQIYRKKKRLNEDSNLSFDAKLCETYYERNSNFKRMLFKELQNRAYKLFVFNFDEEPETIKLGARRMLEQRLELFQQCQNMVEESGNTKTEVGFALQAYPKPFEFFESPWALQNFVFYYKILNRWASRQDNVVVFLPALDEKNEDDSETIYLGWWTQMPFESKTSNYTVALTDKQMWALHVSKEKLKEAVPMQNGGNVTIINKNVYYSDTIFRNGQNTTIYTIGGLTRTQIVLIASCGLAILGLTVVCSALSIRYYYQKKVLSGDEIDEFFNGNGSVEVKNGETCIKAPYDKTRYEIDENKYSLESENVLGAGEFGKVLRGIVERPEGNMSVAVKTTNPQTNHVTTLKGLLSEVKLLAYIGKHKNIVELVGANTANLKSGKIWIFLELCELGSLQKYLRKIREPTASYDVVGYSIDGNETSLTNEQPKEKDLVDATVRNDLYRWTTEICCGMEYLATKHVVHADLATRNVLLSMNKEAKICDFGLSRRMYNYTDYVKSGQEPLPWKWMAPESLRFMQFSEKSDVWSFGITVWELYSLGETPYQGLSWDLNFSNLLEGGLRPSEPAFNEREMYQLMLNCWNNDADKRPSFSELWTFLTAND